jgi:hypothetical protein
VYVLSGEFTVTTLPTSRVLCTGDKQPAVLHSPMAAILAFFRGTPASPLGSGWQICSQQVR